MYMESAVLLAHMIVGPTILFFRAIPPYRRVCPTTELGRTTRTGPGILGVMLDQTMDVRLTIRAECGSP